jgi:hypothetical protein
MSGNSQPVLPKGYSEPSYAVNRPSDAGPSSPQSPDIDDDDRPMTPPPYSGPTTASMSQPQQPVQEQLHYPGLPRLDYKLYTPATFTLSSDSTTITSYEPRFSTHSAALVSLVQSLATVPPKPQIRIVGKSAATTGEIDFDVKINLMNLIVTEDPKRRMNYVKLIGPGEEGFRGETTQTTSPSATGGLEEWARLFCGDKSSIKQFVALCPSLWLVSWGIG